MRKLRLISFFLFVWVVSPSPAAEGLVSLLSHNDVKRTVDKLESKAKTLGMTIFIRLDHGTSVKQALGKTQREKELLVLGNPKLGGALMGLSDTIGLELPLKIFTYRDKAGKVWITYPDPLSIAARHGITDSSAAEKMSLVLSKLTIHAATNEAAKLTP